MSRFCKLSHMIGHCQYRIVRGPKCRVGIVVGVGREVVQSGIQAIRGLAGCEAVVMIPPKVAVSACTVMLGSDDEIAGLEHFGFDKRPV